MSACAVCDLPITKNDSRKTLPWSNAPVHAHCDTEYPTRICRDTECEWWMTDHAGPCSR